MTKLLNKEFRLAASPLSWIFLVAAAMTLLPGYPILMGAFFVCLGIFQSFQNAREANDVLYTVLLPVRKADFVRAKYAFTCCIELIAFVLTAALTGLFYGLFLHAQADGKRRILRAVTGQALVSLICFAGLNTLWAFLMGYARTSQYIVTRLVVNAVAYPIYTLVLLLIWRYRKNLERAVRA